MIKIIGDYQVAINNIKRELEAKRLELSELLKVIDREKSELIGIRRASNETRGEVSNNSTKKYELINEIENISELAEKNRHHFYESVDKQSKTLDKLDEVIETNAEYIRTQESLKSDIRKLSDRKERQLNEVTRLIRETSEYDDKVKVSKDILAKHEKQIKEEREEIDNAKKKQDETIKNIYKVNNQINKHKKILKEAYAKLGEEFNL